MRARCLLFCIIILVAVGILASSGYAKVDPKTIVGLWFFDEGKGDVAKDSSGNGNDGELSGPEWVQGKFGTALNFDGVEDYVTVEDSDSLDFDTGPFTVALWFKPNSIPASGNHWLYDKGYPDNPTRLCFGFREGFIDVYANAWADFGVEVSADQWYHLAVVRDGDEITLYLDGNEEGTAGGYGAHPYTNEKPLIFGTRTDKSIGGTYNFDGIMDEVLATNTALTADEIKEVINGLTAVEPGNKLTTTWAGIKVED